MPLPAGFRALEIRDYRVYYAGTWVSQICNWMQTVTQSWLVLELTSSPFLLGLIATLQFGPILLFSVFAGILADRVTKRNVLILTQAVQSALALTLGLLVWSGHARYWTVAVMAVMWGIMSALDQPTRQSFIIELVGRQHLASAVGMNSASFNSARIVGPAVAGLLIARFGLPQAFLFNAVSFLSVIIALGAVRTAGDPQPATGATILEQISGGLQYAAATPLIRFILSLLVSVSFFVINFNVLIPLIAKHVLHGGAEDFGWLMASLGAGAIMGALTLAMLVTGRPPLALPVTAAFVVSAGTLALAGVGRFAPAVALLLVVGFSQIVFQATCNTMLQITAPDGLRGRVMSLYAVTFAGITPFGSLVVGWVAENFGTWAACALGGGAGLLSVAILTTLWRPRRREHTPIRD